MGHVHGFPVNEVVHKWNMRPGVLMQARRVREHSDERVDDYSGKHVRQGWQLKDILECCISCGSVRRFAILSERDCTIVSGVTVFQTPVRYS